MDPFSKDKTSTPPAEPSTPPPTTATPAIQPAISEPKNTPAVPMQTGHVEKSNKLLYLFIGMLLVLLIGLIGLFFYNRLSVATSAENQIVVPTTEPQASPTIVVPTYASEEEKEVMGVEVGAVESQLNIIENDVNKL